MTKERKKDRTKVTPALERRVDKLRDKARSYIAKSEVLQFRLDEKTYQELFSLAEAERKSVGTLVREWVTAIVKQRLAASNQLPAPSTTNDAVFLVQEQQSYYALESKVNALQKQLNDLSQFTHKQLD
jgi:hypothetical protein